MISTWGVNWGYHHLRKHPYIITPWQLPPCHKIFHFQDVMKPWGLWSNSTWTTCHVCDPLPYRPRIQKSSAPAPNRKKSSSFSYLRHPSQHKSSAQSKSQAPKYVRRPKSSDVAHVSDSRYFRNHFRRCIFKRNKYSYMLEIQYPFFTDFIDIPRIFMHVSEAKTSFTTLGRNRSSVQQHQTDPEEKSLTNTSLDQITSNWWSSWNLLGPWK